jgi:predicted nucleic acid-binding Zn ribbon protein
MPTCPHCGATVPEGAVYCGNCGAALSSPTTSMPTSSQPQTSSQTAWPKEASSGDMQSRLENAMRRAEQLSYAVAGMGVIILVLVVLSALFPSI